MSEIITPDQNRWVNGINRDTLVRDAVRLTLQHQLNAVLNFLALAAEKSCDDFEYVHHLRVSVRRMGTALRVYRRALPKKELCSIRKKLETIRRSAGEARDLDVFLEHVIGTGTGASNSLAARIKHQREKAQRPIVRCFVKAGRKKGLKNRLFKMLARIQKNKESASRLVGVWAKKQLRDAIDRFYHALPSDSNDLQSVHGFRIRTKELRYTIELLNAAFPVERTCSVFPLVETLQQRLGDINDRAVTISILNELSVRASKRRDRIKLKQKKLVKRIGLKKHWPAFKNGGRMIDRTNYLIHFVGLRKSPIPPEWVNDTLLASRKERHSGSFHITTRLRKSGGIGGCKRPKRFLPPALVSYLGSTYSDATSNLVSWVQNHQISSFETFTNTLQSSMG